MRFSKTDNIHKIIRITGSQDNILGVAFDKKNKSDNFSLESVNQSLGTNYKLSKIYFSPFDIQKNRIYSGLIATLIRHYHSGNEFKEV